MSVSKFEIISTNTAKNKPHINYKNQLVIPNIKYSYKYYLEVSNYNPKTLCKEYFILFNNFKFDERCYKCKVEKNGILTINIHNELKDYVIREIKDKGYIDVQYLESQETYDIWEIK